MRLEDIGDEPPIATPGIKPPGELVDGPQPMVELSDAEADRRGGTHEAVAVEGLLGAEVVARPGEIGSGDEAGVDLHGVGERGADRGGCQHVAVQVLELLSWRVGVEVHFDADPVVPGAAAGQPQEDR